MSYRRVLAVVEESPGLDARLDCAGALAARHGARVTGIHVMAPPLNPAIAEAQISAEALERHQEQCEALAARLRTQFDERLADHSGAPERAWELAHGVGYDPIAAQCSYHDLVVAPQRVSEDERLQGRQSPAELVLTAARPVVLVPAAWSAGPAFQAGAPVFPRITVAWNGKRESARAVLDSLPLLAAATDVEAVTVDRDRDAAEGAGLSDRLAAYLADHGAPARAVRASTDHSRVFDVLLEQVSRFESDLIVMGGYAHSRLRELFLGGMTQKMIEAMPCPVLMSH